MEEKQTSSKTERLTPQQLRAKFTDIEKRTFKTTFEKRADGDGEGRTIHGYAAVFNRETNMGWYTEIIEEGAFDEAINNSDCRALFNHEANLLLARQSSGTLKLSIDKTGLHYEFDSPETTTGNDIVVMIERGDLKESSFAFTIEEQEWVETQMEDGWEYKRTIKKVRELFDVAPVTYPAYGDTTVAKRSFNSWQEKNKTPKEEYKNRYTTKFIDQRLKEYSLTK